MDKGADVERRIRIGLIVFLIVSLVIVVMGVIGIISGYFIIIR